MPFLMRASEDRSGPLVTCTGNPCQSTGTSSPVSTGDLPVLPVQVTNGPDRSSEALISHATEAPPHQGPPCSLLALTLAA